MRASAEKMKKTAETDAGKGFCGLEGKPLGSDPKRATQGRNEQGGLDRRMSVLWPRGIEAFLVGQLPPSPSG
jgi:hypothetical protein